MLENYSERVRFVRSLTKLSREGFEKKYGISRNTLKSWELGINTLTEKSAKLISDAVNQEGFSCTPEWLIFGLGSEPRYLSENEDKILSDDINQQAKIIYEADYFKKNHSNAVIYMMTDASMEPLYRVGDYVGGLRLDNFSYFKKLIGSPCIIALRDGIKLIRKLLLAKNDLYLLCPENKLFKSDVVKKEDIISIASIVWHRTTVIEYSYDA